MSDRTMIQWTDATWNPTRGCSRVSPGCENCYAERVAHRFSGPGKPYEGMTRLTRHGACWTGRVEIVNAVLNQPLRWQRPRRIFVNSMSDLFHEALSDEAIDRVFAVMAAARRHTFQVLTKRAARMQTYIGRLSASITPLESAARACGYTFKFRGLDGREHSTLPWPIPNVWLGVSVEDQHRADERIPLLLKTPVAVRFVSYEPALGPVDFRPYLIGHEETGTPFSDPPARTVGGCAKWTPPLSWIIVGGESGRNGREFDIAWARATITQCRVAGVACFVKQLGANVIDCADDTPITDATWWAHLRHRGGADPTEWPEELRVREWPA